MLRSSAAAPAEPEADAVEHRWFQTTFFPEEPSPASARQREGPPGAGPSPPPAPPTSRGAWSRDGPADGGGAAAALRAAGMEVFIPSFRYEESELERGYTVRCAGAGHARASGKPSAGSQRGLRCGTGQRSMCRGRPALRAQAGPDLPSPAVP